MVIVKTIFRLASCHTVSEVVSRGYLSLAARGTALDQSADGRVGWSCRGRMFSYFGPSRKRASVPNNHMMETQFPRQDKVELHVHLDGSVRLETVLDLGRKRGIPLPSDCKEELATYCRAINKKNLTEFLACFEVFTPTFVGNPDSIERIAYEFCEDSALDGILYSEVRYSPHLLIGTGCTPSQVVEAVNKGLAMGSRDFNITVRTILCCMRHEPKWSSEVLDLCQRYKDQGVVGIDLAGDELKFALPTPEEHIKVFKRAKELGIHRTVHAGENGPAENVREAVELMHAERIGHGYHALDDPDLYNMMLKKRIQFEMCPQTSFLTGSVSKNPADHPIIRVCRDGANFSINSDDTTLTGLPLSADYNLVTSAMNFTRKDIALSNLNAAMSSFLPEHEKENLVRDIKKLYSKELDGI